MKKMRLTLLVCFALLACVSVLVACTDTHVHAFGEWETVQEPTYTEDGVKSRCCSCGEKQSENIKKLTPQTTMLSSLECKNELQEVYNNSVVQKNLWYTEDGVVYAIDVNGEHWIYYEAWGNEEDWNEAWCGNCDGEYYWFSKETTSSETSQIREKIPQDEVEEYDREIKAFGTKLFRNLADTIAFVAKSTDFECLKTIGETTTYQIKLIVDDEVVNITITVENGLITVFDGDNYVTATYTYDKVITLPDKADYPLE